MARDASPTRCAGSYHVATHPARIGQGRRVLLYRRIGPEATGIDGLLRTTRGRKRDGKPRTLARLAVDRSCAPWRCATCLTIARPRPVPPVSRERLRSIAVEALGQSRYMFRRNARARCRSPRTRRCRRAAPSAPTTLPPCRGVANRVVHQIGHRTVQLPPANRPAGNRARRQLMSCPSGSSASTGHALLFALRAIKPRTSIHSSLRGGGLPSSRDKRQQVIDQRLHAQRLLRHQGQVALAFRRLQRQVLHASRQNR
jgi:hypothetical protein